MNNDSVRSPNGSGYSAKPEPKEVSAVPVSIPNAAHVVTRRVGSYEYTETLVVGFPTEAEATRFIIEAEDEWRAAVDAVPDTLDYPEDNAPDAAWKTWTRRRKRAWKRFRGMLTCDPEAAPDGEWASPDEPTYYAQVVPLFASAIEARRAATPQSDAVHESAASEAGDAPTVEVRP
jgi:hypothetical protein